MTRTFNARIYYTTDEGHPDTSEITRQMYEDTYKIQDECFYGDDDIMEYIKEDMALVAGGGYNTKHIHSVIFDIREVS